MREELEPAMEKMAEEYKPSNAELLRDYEITIRFLSRGCTVRIGCKEIAFEDVNKAMSQINEYVTGDTYEVQKQWLKILG
jgi:hypothetical protein